jgi:hypothetical protein
VLRLGQVERLAIGICRPVSRASIARPPASSTRRAAPPTPRRPRPAPALQLARRVEAGVAEHEGDARGVGAQVHRGEVGVGGEHAHVVERHAELLADDVGDQRVRALADVARAGEDGDAPGAVDLQLHRALRHPVRVDRVVGPGDVAAPRHPDAAAEGQLPVLRFQSLARSTASRHCRKPLEVTRSSLTVRVISPMKLRRRSSIGSMPSRSASLSSVTSKAKRGCTLPCPRFGPHAGLLVKTRVLSKR